MPDIQSIPEVLYQANQPYHVYYDNLPLRNILDRIGLVNIQVDTTADIVRGASGSAGSLNARLDASLDGLGHLKSGAVDMANHGIASHSDGGGFVRMTDEERTKLSSVQNEANRLDVEIEDSVSEDSVAFPPTGSNGTLKLRKSSTVFFEFENPDIVRIHSVFPPDAAHKHSYDLVPAYDVPSGPTRKIYRTTAVNTPFEEGSLRVYVNGVRLTNSPVKVLDYSSTTPVWVSNYILNQDSAGGTFELNRALSPSDVIRIDFDKAILPPPGSSSSS